MLNTIENFGVNCMRNIEEEMIIAIKSLNDVDMCEDDVALDTYFEIVYS